MAANIVTALNQILEAPEREMRWLQQGLDNTLTFSTLEYEDWQRMHRAYLVGQDAVLLLVRDLLPKYEASFKLLGEPSTAEQWIEMQYDVQFLEAA